MIVENPMKANEKVKYKHQFWQARRVDLFH